MREIKLRAWDQAVNKMYAGGVSLRIAEGGRVLITSCSWQQKQKDSVILLQFTGLKDKNGKDIYEGDILEFKDNKIYRSLVIWDLYGFTTNYFLPSEWQYAEVIGNIYENSNLMETNSGDKE